MANKMLRKIFLFSLIVFLTACSSTNNVPVEVTSTATSIPPTATVTPSPIPSATPTLSPSEIQIGAIDSQYPEAGPKPDGATDIDIASMEWIKPNPENQSKPFHWKEVAQGWFTDLIVNSTYPGGGIPMVEGVGSYESSVMVKFWGEEGGDFPTIQHIPQLHIAADSFPGIFAVLISWRLENLKPESSMSGAQTVDALNQLAAGAAKISFGKNGDPNQYTYLIRSGQNYTSINIFLKTSELSNPDFIRLDGNKKIYFQGSMSVDNQGNLNAVEYAPVSLQDSPYPLAFVRRTLTYPFTVFVTSDLSQQSELRFWNSIGSDAFYLSVVISNTVHGKNPYLIITPPSSSSLTTPTATP